MTLGAGTQLGRYEIRSQIGEGGMGEVYLAHDTKLHRRVALKILTAEFCEDSQHTARFLREAQAASALNHPNIFNEDWERFLDEVTGSSQPATYSVYRPEQQLSLAISYKPGERYGAGSHLAHKQDYTCRQTRAALRVESPSKSTITTRSLGWY